MSLLEAKKSPFEALYEISQRINTLQEIDPLLNQIMDIAMEALAAERGFILLRSDSAPVEFSARVARNISDQAIADITQISTSVVNRVIHQGKPVLSYDAQEDERFRGAESVVLHRIHSVACVPLRIRERLIGAIYVDSLSSRGRFTEESITFLSAFASLAAIAIENAQLYQRVREEKRRLEGEVRRIYRFEEIIGQSPKMQEVFDLMGRILDSDASVLIEGESGTGKELVARAIHYNGPRKDKPFIAVFCGSLPESLLESELFGHKKGAFTGALEDKKGLFEVADGGTFFLDEIAEVSPAIQTKLLRVLQEGEIRRVGETKVRKVDVRIIAATNRHLADEVRQGRFREDLFYRLNVITIQLPPLRERRKDIALLAAHFLSVYAQKYRRPVRGLTSEAMDVLMHYPWPGNVRELENTIERAVVLARGPEIQPEDLRIPRTTEELFEPGITLREFERRLVLKTLADVGGNRTKAAEVLGVSRRWLQYQLRQWGEKA